jgi:hypothetical protein
MHSEPTTPTTESKARLRLAAVAAPRATAASRHTAITRDLTSYSKYKRWAESHRHGWTVDGDEGK